ncbi:hypothetical protein [Halopiger goleimassiliensis]|uniref:hypothetical protein n=1 Tax=Halopiger goleimassiliensis TaxID=1293048 RepID=UPI000677FFC6|nr:hypothetical protein [Halopiger goleimassiliensis]
MPDDSSPGRRRLLRSVAGGGLSLPLVGCLERLESSASTERFGERPFPPELVGDEAYAAALEDRIDRDRFPDPNADLLPELTKARFVADAARAGGAAEFADRIDRLREPVFEPFVRFEAVMTLVTDRDRLEGAEIDALVTKAGLENESVPLDAEPGTIIETALDERERTFTHYPGPPLHVIESAESRGRELLDEGPDERAQAVDADHRPYVRQRATIEAIVAGGREIAAEAYDDVIDRITDESPSNRTYEDENEYAEVVAFNAAVAGDSMLEEDGQLLVPP